MTLFEFTVEENRFVHLELPENERVAYVYGMPIEDLSKQELRILLDVAVAYQKRESAEHIRQLGVLRGH